MAIPPAIKRTPATTLRTAAQVEFTRLSSSNMVGVSFLDGFVRGFGGDLFDVRGASDGHRDRRADQLDERNFGTGLAGPVTETGALPSQHNGCQDTRSELAR